MPVFVALSRLLKMKGSSDMNRKAIALTLFTLNLAIGAARADQVQDNSQTNTSSGDRTAASPVRAGQDTEVRNLQPFTHFTWIPADSDKGTIRFERAKMVQVPTRITYTMNYCQELAFRDPGGSMYCPYAQTESPAPAYEVTYSYIGRPLASDEYGGRNITFYVYFRPDELAPDVRQALTAKKRDRADLAEYFTVNAFREPVRRIVIDQAQSRFCDGNFVGFAAKFGRSHSGAPRKPSGCKSC
jgi:hypothetical protein